MKKKMSKTNAMAAIAGLSKATTTTKKSTVKLNVEGYEALVDDAVQRQRELESLQAEQEEALSNLRVIGLTAMREHEERQFTKTCRVKGETQDVRITRKDAYSKLDPEHEDALRQMLGDDRYDTLFTQGIDLKLTADPATFIADCRRAKLSVSKYFTRTDWIKPGKGFLEVRASLRRTMKPADNDVLDAVTDRVSNKLSVGFKG